MSLPSTERTSPRHIAKAATASGHFHDVVIAASKVLHDAPLTKEDLATLRWARGLLKTASAPTVVLDMPSAQELSGPGSLMATIRRAAQPDGGNPDEPLRELRQGIDRCLKGERGEPVATAMVALRELFTVVSRLALQADVLSQGEPPAAGSWALSTTISLS